MRRWFRRMVGRLYLYLEDCGYDTDEPCPGCGQYHAPATVQTIELVHPVRVMVCEPGDNRARH